MSPACFIQLGFLYLNSCLLCGIALNIFDGESSSLLTSLNEPALKDIGHVSSILTMAVNPSLVVPSKDFSYEVFLLSSSTKVQAKVVPFESAGIQTDNIISIPLPTKDGNYNIKFQDRTGRYSVEASPKPGENYFQFSHRSLLDALGCHDIELVTGTISMQIDPPAGCKDQAILGPESTIELPMELLSEGLPSEEEIFNRAPDNVSVKLYPDNVYLFDTYQVN